MFPGSPVVSAVSGDEALLLVEQKVVTTRMMKKGQMPDYYVPQVKSGLATIKLTELALYTECQFLVLSRDALSMKCVTGKTFNVFDRCYRDAGFTEETVDNYCHYGKQRGIIVIRSSADHAAYWRQHISKDHAIECEIL